MKAARWHGPGDIRIETVPDPRPRADEALVSVELVGLCGSDAEEYLRGPVVARPPVILGHEIVGTVAEPAADGSGPREGTRVVVDVVTGCGQCFWCRRHNEGLCPYLVVSGLDVDGGLAELVLGKAERLVRVPAELHTHTAVLAEPLAVAVRALRKVGPLLGVGLLIVGGGTIGILTAQLARLSGASPVVIEPALYRRRLLESSGINTVWAESPESRRAAVGAFFPERGPDVMVECSGRSGMPAEGISLVRPGGIAVLLGVTSEPEPLSTLDLVLAEKTVIGSAAHMWDDDVATAANLLASGAISPSLVTHSFGLDQAVEAFRALVEPSVPSIKVVVQV